MTKQKDSTQVQKSKVDEIFTLVKDKENKVHICIGNKAVSSRSFDTFEQANKYIGTKPYELICNIAYVITLQIFEQYEKSKENTAKGAENTESN